MNLNQVRALYKSLKSGGLAIKYPFLVLICLLVSNQMVSAGTTMGQVSSLAGNVVPGVTDAVAIAAQSGSIILRRDGTVICRGDNSKGQTNVPAGLNNVVAVAVGEEHSMVLKKDGTVLSWGGLPTAPGVSNNVIAIAAGGSEAGGFSLILKQNGTVFGWTKNNYWGQTSVPPGLNNVIAIAAGAYHSLALKSDGTVVGWGFNYMGQVNIPPGLTNVVAVSAGGYHSMALKRDGTVVAWGMNDYGEATVPSGLSNVVAIAAGGYHSVALKSNGKVVAWGEPTAANVSASLSNVVAVAGGYYGSTCITAPLEINCVEVTNQNRTVNFHTFFGQQYAVEYSPDLAPNSWALLSGSTISGNGYDVSVIDTAAIVGPRFYRLKQ